jgi:hypothetical protein
MRKSWAGFEIISEQWQVRYAINTNAAVFSANPHGSRADRQNQWDDRIQWKTLSGTEKGLNITSTPFSNTFCRFGRATYRIYIRTIATTASQSPHKY